MTFFAKSTQTYSTPGTNLSAVTTAGIYGAFATDDAGTLVVGNYNEGVIEYSTDAGETWLPAILYPAPGNASILEIIWDGSKFIAVGVLGLYVSYDSAKSWYRLSTLSFKSIAYNGTRYVGLLQDSIRYSTDLSTWTTAITINRTAEASVEWTGTSFIATYANTGSIWRSTDGINWTMSTHMHDTYVFSNNPATNNWIAHSAYNFAHVSSNNGSSWNGDYGYTYTQLPTRTIWDPVNSRYVASMGNYPSLTQASYMGTSSDGKAWTNRYTNSVGAMFGIATDSAGKFAGVGYRSSIVYSTDYGTNWIRSNDSVILPGTSWSWCTGNNDRFIATCSTATNLIVSSDDGYVWKIRVTSTTFAGYTVTGVGEALWNGTMFVALATISSPSSTTVSLYSSDGITWSVGGTLPQTSGWTALAWNGSVWTCVKNNSTNAAYSTDGINWTAATLPVTGNWTRGAGIIGGRIAVVGDSTAVTVYTSDGITWTQGSITNARSWQGLASNGTRLVATAYSSNTSSVSTDGITWTEYLLPANSTWQRVAWNGQAFCVPSNSSSYAAVSADGQTWRQVSLPISSVVACGGSNGRFCILQSASYGHAVSLDNGVSFTTPGAFSWYDIVYANSKFTVVGSNGSTAESSDGINWTYAIKHQKTYTLTSSNNWIGVAASPSGTVVAIIGGDTSTNSYAYSTNGGESFTASTVATTTARAENCITYGNGIFVLANNATTTSYSSNGITWSSSNASTVTIAKVIFENNLFFAFSNSSATAAAISSDGITWTSITMPSAQWWSDVAWNGTRYVAIAGDVYTATNKAAYSSDGTTWTDLTLPQNIRWRSIVWNGSLFIVVAGGRDGGGTLFPYSLYITSPDGITWTERQLPSSLTWRKAAVNSSGVCTLIAGGRYMSYTTGLASSDGITWSPTTFYSGAVWSDIASFGNAFIAVAGYGSSTSTYSKSLDGFIWNASSDAGIKTISTARRIINDGTQYLAVGEGSLIATSPDGSSWTTRISPYGSTLLSLAYSPSAITTTGTVSLLVNGNGTNNGTTFTDSAGGLVPVVTGNAITSTAQSKFGGSSMYFDGNISYLKYVDQNKFDFAYGDFTIEFWVYPTSTSGTRAWVTTADPGDSIGIYIGASNSNIIFLAGINPWFINVTLTTFTINTWMHIAVTRTGNTYRVFKDGVQIYIANNSSKLTNTNNSIQIGGRSNTGQYALGYMQDVRIIRGQSLYTDNFSVPTGALTTTIPTTSRKYVAAGSAGVMLSSSDGVYWNGSWCPDVSINISDVKWTGDKFIACTTQYSAAGGPAEGIISSTDSITWNRLTPNGTSVPYNAIAVGNSKIVMSNGTRSIVSTDDGITWTQYYVRRKSYNASNYTISVSTTANSGSYVNGEYIFAGTNGFIRSTDGIEWNRGLFGYNQFDGARWSDITWTGTNFVIVAGSTFSWDVSTYSPDGIVWSESRLPYIAQWTKVWSNRSVTMARNNSGYYVTSSDHGVTWSQHFTQPYSFSHIIEGNGLFVGLVSGSATCYTSTDGRSWTARTLPSASAWNEGLWTGTNFIAIATSSTNGAYSSDGITWYASTLPYTSATNSGRNMAYGGGRVMLIPYSGANKNRVIYSDDHGVTWSSTATAPTSQYGISSLVYLNGHFVASSFYWYSASDSLQHSNDGGLTWYLSGVSEGSGGNMIMATNGEVAMNGGNGYPSRLYLTYGPPGAFSPESVPYTVRKIGSNVFYGGSSGFIGKT